MSARRHRNDGSQQKPLHGWFSGAAVCSLIFGGCAVFTKNLPNARATKTGATNKDGVSLIPVASAGLAAIVFAGGSAVRSSTAVRGRCRADAVAVRGGVRSARTVV